MAGPAVFAREGPNKRWNMCFFACRNDATDGANLDFIEAHVRDNVGLWCLLSPTFPVVPHVGTVDRRPARGVNKHECKKTSWENPTPIGNGYVLQQLILCRSRHLMTRKNRSLHSIVAFVRQRVNPDEHTVVSGTCFPEGKLRPPPRRWGPHTLFCIQTYAHNVFTYLPISGRWPRVHPAPWTMSRSKPRPVGRGILGVIHDVNALAGLGGGAGRGGR